MANTNEALLLTRCLYEYSLGGCCLHIVLDDGNLSNGDVDFCIKWAVEHKHPDCLILAQLIRKLSKTQRRVLYRDSHKHIGVSWNARPAARETSIESEVD